MVSTIYCHYTQFPTICRQINLENDSFAFPMTSAESCLGGRVRTQLCPPLQQDPQTERKKAAFSLSISCALPTFTFILCFIHTNTLCSGCFSSISQVKKLRLREVTWVAFGHTTWGGSGTQRQGSWLSLVLCPQQHHVAKYPTERGLSLSATTVTSRLKPRLVLPSAPATSLPGNEGPPQPPPPAVKLPPAGNVAGSPNYISAFRLSTT